MRLVSTLKMASLSSDPGIFNDGEMYFNTNNNTIRLSYSGSWVNLIDAYNLEISFVRDINSITGVTASYSYLILDSQQNSILLADSASTVNFVVPNTDTSQLTLARQ